MDIFDTIGGQILRCATGIGVIWVIQKAWREIGQEIYHEYITKRTKSYKEIEEMSNILEEDIARNEKERLDKLTPECKFIPVQSTTNEKSNTSASASAIKNINYKDTESQINSKNGVLPKCFCQHDLNRDIPGKCRLCVHESYCRPSGAKDNLNKIDTRNKPPECQKPDCFGKYLQCRDIPTNTIICKFCNLKSSCIKGKGSSHESVHERYCR